jgi:alpha-amylase
MSRSRHRRALVASTCAIVACLPLGGGCGDSGGDETSIDRPRTAYEIFVRSFADSNGDGVGDLAGLTARLDYLNDGDDATTTDLGVDAVWLMPIYASPSYHGYDVTDYRTVNPQYGTLADFDAFVAAAHQRGIRVLLDFVVNHSSNRHPWFVDASGGATSPRRDYYAWRDADPGWTRPNGSRPWYRLGSAYYYGYFCDCMPDLNLANPAVAADLTDSMKFWLARGVDGFRLDAVRYLFESPEGVLADQPASHDFLRRLRADLSADYPEMLLVAEAWGPLEVQATYSGDDDEAHLAFSFDLAQALVRAAQTGAAAQPINVLGRSEAAFAGKDRGVEAPFLTNHDQVRVMRELLGDAAAARVAAAALFAMPGTPFVYYGEEIGMRGGATSADQNKRTPFHWNATGPGFGFTDGTPWFPSDEAEGVDVASQQANAGSLWNLYRALIAQRRAHAALHLGDATRPAVSGGGAGVLALLRTAPGGGRVLFIANFATTPTGPFTVTVSGSPTTFLAEGLGGAPATSSDSLSVPDLAARGFAYLSLP